MKFVKWKTEFFNKLIKRQWVEIDFSALRIFPNFYIGIARLSDNRIKEKVMGNIKTFWVFGFERWGDLRPSEMETGEGVRYVPLIFGVWIKTKSF